MQDAVAQSFRLSQGQVAVQADELEPADEVDGDGAAAVHQSWLLGELTDGRSRRTITRIPSGRPD